MVQSRIEVVSWLYLYQMVGPGLSWNEDEFASISMYDEYGIVRPALAAWLAA
jgi:hypothetical protein